MSTNPARRAAPRVGEKRLRGLGASTGVLAVSISAAFAASAACSGVPTAPPGAFAVACTLGPPSAGPALAPADHDPQDFPERMDLFPVGVAAGDVDATTAIFWTRYLGDQRTRLWVLERDDGVNPILYTRVAIDAPTCAANDEGIVKLVATGLHPGRTYDYLFLDEDLNGALLGRSRIGTLRIPPSAGLLAPVTFVASADTAISRAPFELLSHVAVENADFFIFLGDTVYADPAVTRVEYRAFYEDNWSDPSLQALMAAMPFYAIWDDHEVFNSWDPTTIDPDRLAAARGAFLEYNTVRESPAEPTRLWRSYRRGDTLEIFILDCRGERRPADGVYISPEQLAWLETGLRDSTAVFKIIVHGVPITEMAGVSLAFDRWEGFPAQRDEILGFIAAEAIRHVYWLTADMHMAFIGDLPEYSGHEVGVGPIAAGLNPDRALQVAQAPNIEFVEAIFNYAILTADPLSIPPTLTVSMRDVTGAEFHRVVLQD
ncbi:MAG TPA: alkaline phosphatase D family protein [Myxococcota bacterium]|nr:alkaline phosphatase D family protein [Myxococcota bacterium]